MKFETVPIAEMQSTRRFHRGKYDDLFDAMLALGEDDALFVTCPEGVKEKELQRKIVQLRCYRVRTGRTEFSGFVTCCCKDGHVAIYRKKTAEGNGK